jgi:hypothetical protein
MVEAIEDHFVPVLVYNNKKGVHEQTLNHFKEPSWNNPVARFLAADESDLIPRKDRVWHTQPMASRMVAALNAAKRQAPDFLKSLADQKPKLKRATFAMHCYWEGEGRLGGITGVANTRSAWVDGLEVVELIYDPKQVEYSTLLENALSFKCASKVFAHDQSQLQAAKKAVGKKAVMHTGKSRVAKVSDQKYYLRNTPGLKQLPLTQYQSTKVNSALMSKSDIASLLSPRQIATFKKITKILKSDSKNSLSKFVFPEDDSKLAAYQAELDKVLSSKELVK